MIIAENAQEIPDRFKPCGGGFANQVFYDERNGVVLKVYSKNEYYLSEMRAFNSGCQYMPKLLEKGVVGKQNYVAMPFIGTSINELSDMHCEELSETMASLHAHSSIEQMPPFDRKFHLSQEHKQDISTIFSIDTETLFRRLHSHIHKNTVFSLVHGDITLSNLRNVSGKMFLIDFDEASYLVPEFDIAKLYWSDIKPLQNIKGMEKFIALYNQSSKHEVIFDNSMRDWILFAGLDFWLWRYVNLQSQPALIQEAQERLLAYKKYQHEA